MCAIVGYVGENSSIEIVKKMLNRLSHRGPDGEGIKKYNNVVLGMNRLAIIDNKPHQIPYEKGGLAIVYNGEIFNHNEICCEANFDTSSDIERVLQSYIEKKESSFKDLNGMYAFAIMDRDKLILVRDKVGKMPLYYVKKDNFFAFASEIKALLEIVNPTFNEDITYETFEFSCGKETMFKDIYQLLPGEYLIYENGKIVIKSYYKIWENRIELPDDETRLVLKLSDLIEDAVLIRTKNRVHNFTTLLSGGIDSSLITAIAKPDIIYTAHYDYSDFDELDYAKILAKSINRQLKVIKPTKEEFIKYNDEIIYYMDSPPTWTSFTLYMLLKEIKKDNIKIVLSGEGADELFGGYYRYLLIYHDELLKKIPLMENYQFLINRYYGSVIDRYAKIVNRGDDRSYNYLKTYLQNIFNHSKDSISFMGIADFYSTMQILLQMSERLSFANNIENRSPFLDHRIIEFAISLDEKYKIKNYTTKYLLKEVAKKFIPKEIVQRKDKRGFSAPINRWFGEFETKQYDRGFYKQLVFKRWKEMFGV